MQQAGIIAVMCPTMSMVAAILFNGILARQPITQLPAIWAGTVIKNFPMAFFRNMFAPRRSLGGCSKLRSLKNDLTFSKKQFIIPNSVWRKRKSDFAALFLIIYLETIQALC